MGCTHPRRRHCNSLPELLLLTVLFAQLSITLISASALRHPASSSGSPAHAPYDFSDHVSKENKNPSKDTINTVRTFRLVSQCNNLLVQIKGKHVSAKAKVDNPRYADLRFETVNFGSVVRIQSEKSRNFLCFNKKGRLVVRHAGDSSLCRFHEEQSDGAYQFRSVEEPEWLVGFRKNGKRAPGNRWARRHKGRKGRTGKGKRRRQERGGGGGAGRHARRHQPAVHPCYRFSKVDFGRYVDDVIKGQAPRPGFHEQLQTHFRRNQQRQPRADDT